MSEETTEERIREKCINLDVNKLDDEDEDSLLDAKKSLELFLEINEGDEAISFKDERKSIGKGEKESKNLILKALKWKEERVEFLSKLMEVYNLLGIHYIQRLKSKDSIHFMQLSLSLYHSFVSKHADHPLCEEMEKKYTHSLFYLAQIYSKMEDAAMSAYYCSLTLDRQLKSGDYDLMEWSVGSLQLSAYFNSSEQWVNTVRCLIASEKMLERAKATEQEIPEDSDANLHIGWGKYHMNKLISLSSSTFDSSSRQLFEGLELIDEEDKVLLEAPRAISGFDEAKFHFQRGNDRFNKAKAFYTLDNHVTDHYNICQDQYSLYSSLVHFESNPSNQCKMHKRKADLLEPMIKELNPIHFQHLLRQIMIELGETYNQMVDIKIGLNPNNPAKVKKINQLITKSTQYFQMFVKTCHVKDKVPQVLDEGIQEAYIVSRITMGRLYSKVIVPDTKVKARYVGESLKHFEWVVDYYKRNKTQILQKEFELCKEMVSILPARMNALMNGTQI
eukprot:TRINITY_DN12756_c0_g1_i1.p1 TRINITY_DN12756_c0_g1~~TRINITY_DN12756_c0_g1_i1.p1  ORF type:complete len:505 (+),score=149.87 TRINITY_DN12756_c0_g1_i1:195-1709(+)